MDAIISTFHVHRDAKRNWPIRDHRATLRGDIAKMKCFVSRNYTRGVRAL